MLQKLRGHDSEVVSLEWTLIHSAATPSEAKASTPSENESIAPVEPSAKTQSGNQALPELKLSTPTKTVLPRSFQAHSSATKVKIDKIPEQKISRRDRPQPIVDADDMFDMHSYDYLEDEFGAVSSTRSATPSRSEIKGRESNKDNENFNFIEECQTLREKITNNDSDSDDSYEYTSSQNLSAVNMSDIRNMIQKICVNPNESLLISDDLGEVDKLSNLSTIGSSHNTTEIAELEDVIKDLNINDDEKDDIEAADTVYLASGAQESFVVIWDAEAGTIADKIHVKAHGRLQIPSKSNN